LPNEITHEEEPEMRGQIKESSALLLGTGEIRKIELDLQPALLDS
jgi:hypothetical protein